MSSTKQKIFVIIVFVLVVLFGVGQFFISGVSAPAQPGQNSQTTGAASASSTSVFPATQVVQFTPPELASTTPVENGTCFASSVAAPYRADAWRCTVQNAISDPCFAIQGSANLSAAEDLVTGAGTGFILEPDEAASESDESRSPSANASATASSRTIPSNWAWLLQLGDGTVCSPFTGTRPFTAAGDVATYSCNGSSTGESLVFGELNNTSATWYAEVGSLSAATSTFPPVIVSSSTVPVSAVLQ